MSKTVFDFDSYKDYLNFLVGPRDKRAGLRSTMAKTLNCQPTYVSQVLYGHAHLSLEQGDTLSDYFGHSRDEKHFFLLLIQKERAGTKRLESFFDEEMQALKNRRLVLTERLGTKGSLNPVQQATYYSSWQYAAIHIALTIPDLRQVANLSKFFNIPRKRVVTVLDFLCSSGLAIQKGSEYHAGKVQVRVGNSSPEIIKHHTHWRMQAIDSLERETLKELHYSGIVSLSKKDVLKIKDQTLQFIQDAIKVIRDSKEEELYCLNIDFFNTGKNSEKGLLGE